MTTVAASSPPRVAYRTLFFWALLAASLLPACTLLFSYEFTNPALATNAFALSALLYASSTHTWITAAYYTDKSWLAHFNKRPMAYYAAPIAILVAGTAVATQPLFQPFGVLAVTYVAVTVNIWHHSRQNWGVLSLVGKNRGVNVLPLRRVLQYAWIGFIPVICVVWPNGFGIVQANPWLQTAGLAGAALYLAVFAVVLVRSGAWRDPLVLLFAAALGFYFVPLATLADRPYGLLLFKYAHALQYYLLVALSLSVAMPGAAATTTPSSFAASALKVGGVLFVLAVLGFVAWRMVTQSGGAGGYNDIWVRFAMGLTMSVALAHFWLDAFIWKMSDKTVRELHGGAFAFR